MELLGTIGYFTPLSEFIWWRTYLELKDLLRIEKLKNLYKVEKLKDWRIEELI